MLNVVFDVEALIVNGHDVPVSSSGTGVVEPLPVSVPAPTGNDRDPILIEELVVSMSNWNVVGGAGVSSNAVAADDVAGSLPAFEPHAHTSRIIEAVENPKGFDVDT